MAADRIECMPLVPVDDATAYDTPTVNSLSRSECCFNAVKLYRSLIWALLVVLVASPLLFDSVVICQAQGPSASKAAAVGIIMGCSWAFELVPISTTALFPLVLFPLFGLDSAANISRQYMNSTIMLILGSSAMAQAIEKYNIHKWLALKIILCCGMKPPLLLMAFMGVSAFLSMWLSNTATAVMMLPMAMETLCFIDKASIVREGDSTEHHSSPVFRRYSTGLIIGIPYCCTLGGLATLTGTGTNVAFVGQYSAIFPNGPEISFARWFLFGLPISACIVLVTWCIFVYRFCPTAEETERYFVSDDAYFLRQLESLGHFGWPHKVVVVDFILMAVLWLLRSPGFMPGWVEIFYRGDYISDSTVALFVILILYFIPDIRIADKDVRILDADTIKNLPWSVILLLGGGFALAEGFRVTGLQQCIGGSLASLGSLPIVILLVIITSLASGLSELISNVAAVTIVLPIVAALAVAIQVHPLALMIPATMACSMAFMLPASTPPNSIAFSTGTIHVLDMVKAGICIKVLGICVVVLGMVTIGMPVYGIKLHSMPEWAVL